ncbi:retrovirus-related pol polyprotein from transposon TNT 1-94 [Tanacetum coccineum]
MKLCLFLPEEGMSMLLICHLTMKKVMLVSLPKHPIVLTGFGIRDYPTSTSKNINKLTRQNLVAGLPSLTFLKDKTCLACEKGKSIIFKRYGKTAYDVFRGRSPDIIYFYMFGYPVHIHNHKDHLGKFNAKADDGFFLCYSPVDKAFRVFNIKRQEMEKTYHVIFSEDDEAISKFSTEGDEINFNENRSFPDDEFLNLNSPDEHPTIIIADDHLVLNKHDDSELVEDLEITKDQAGVTTRSRIRDSEAALSHECLYVNFLSQIEPKKLIEALEEEGWIIAMQEELNQFERNKEGIDFDETFTPVARLEAIGIFLAYAVYMGFVVFQMDVKSAFLNGKISKEVYVQQPPGFESSEFPNHVCKLGKALYGLKQAPRACASVKCPMLPPNNLGPDESRVYVNETLFRGMIGSLMYLTASRPDIQFSICLCARYQAHPKESHLSAKKQSSVAMSSTEAKYVAVAGCCAQVL